MARDATVVDTVTGQDGACLIHPVQVRIIEDETAILSEDNAALADAKLAEPAQSKTFGELRYAAHRLVLTLDPEAAARRKEQARQDAHVRRFREDSGNAGMIARELPPDEILASWQHVEQRALDLRAAGVPGTLQELRVRAFLDLLQERDARTAASTGQAGPGEPGPQDGPGDSGNSDSGNGDPGPGPQDGPTGTSPGGGAARQPGTGAGSQGPSLAALVTLTVPLATLLGQSGTPGEAGGVRAPGPRHRPGPSGHRRPQPGYSLVPDRPAPRRHRRRARLCPRPRPRPPGSAEPHVQRRHPWPLPSCPGPRRLPARPQTAAPGHRQKRSMYRPGLQPACGPLRPGPHHPLAPRWGHVRM